MTYLVSVFTFISLISNRLYFNKFTKIISKLKHIKEKELLLKHIRAHGGITLIPLYITLAIFIIGIFSAVAIPYYNTQSTTKNKQDIQSIESTSDTFKNDNNIGYATDRTFNSSSNQTTVQNADSSQAVHAENKQQNTPQLIRPNSIDGMNESQISNELSKVNLAHPDWIQIFESEGFKKWLEKNQNYSWVVEYGDANSHILMLNDYKSQFKEKMPNKRRKENTTGASQQNIDAANNLHNYYNY